MDDVKIIINALNRAIKEYYQTYDTGDLLADLQDIIDDFMEEVKNGKN